MSPTVRAVLALLSPMSPARARLLDCRPLPKSHGVRQTQRARGQHAFGLDTHEMNGYEAAAESDHAWACYRSL